MTARPDSRQDRIFLTGFMGSGKSTIGPILANTIGYEFADVDRTIEVAEHCSIDRIFREKGEAHFRTLERDTIALLSVRTGLVVALGGGALVDPATLREVLIRGILVYIKLSAGQLFRRLRHQTDRPLLTDEAGHRLTDAQLKERIRQLVITREPLYARADVTIEADERQVGVTVDQIVRKLAPMMNPHTGR